MTQLMDCGIGDIIPNDVNLDMLISKLRKVQTEAQVKDNQQESKKQGTSGSHGRLADMNVIDLLQALGPNKRTAKITVNDSTGDRTLIIFLDRGVISYAELDDELGASAVHEGIFWSEGSWTVEVVSQDELPESNNQTPNEAILLEGCHLMDKRIRSGQLL
jgi:hypothetical protein